MKDTISIETLNWCLRWKKAFAKGDYVVEHRQKGVKYLLETLEPEGIDFFIGIFRYDVTAKEGYSSYVLRILQPRS
jgi:hypothetical protein